ncbi:MAG: Indolepyruvate oxidoreductase subunit IorA [Candidatus Ozemobacter sibiricus]|jgi:indolepyruvate ferredoxin oxidoreductase alpha subunit|uniref:Indolepyruvate oxidoreductase subunit IorA n=1 Tax=Candidatus Ozemobacter sibiricus TaxID=2268124 RepID=A0A367ZTY5_9BACT|nr:MAG: Indolepyruvate oxidoreductase subunit IorA [Candidatus Ozemobacter sibiricus]
MEPTTSPGRAVLSGNAAIARGAWEAGVRFAAAYPGTPSTEILEHCGTYPEIDAQWAVNEKTALETALGACYGGARALCAQKHVGLNVAADPFFTASYTGVNGGFVIVSADDPGMHSSQNEQDNRFYARMAKVPLFEPSSSQEAKDMTAAAFLLSEQFDTPVLLRTTTRISHSEGIVTLGPRQEAPAREFTRNMAKYCVLPSNARQLHVKVEERMKALEDWACTCPWNRIEKGDPAVGIITSGISYAYAREVFPQASYLKLGFTNPFPAKLVREFAATVKTLIVIEENDPFLEEKVRALGLACIGKDRIPICGELNPDILARALPEFTVAPPPARVTMPSVEIPVRPPVLCPGCPHRGVFFLLRKLDVHVTGDIGCYSLGALPPHHAMHTIVCMGAAITNALGIEKAMHEKVHGKLVAVLGESTFIHSGITGLIDTVYNQGRHLTIILDNSITAMTGHQHNPASGYTLKGKPTHRLNLAKICEAAGVKHVTTVDPFDLKALEAAIKEGLAAPEPSVLITKRPCILLKGYKPEQHVVRLNRVKCVKCGQCWKAGCPAIERDPVDGKTVINATLCVHCGVCARICRPGAITQDNGGQS